MKIKEEVKRFWHWLWNSDSWLSYLVFLIFVFIAIKFIFFPLLSIAFNAELPMAIVESSSMDHDFLKYCISFNAAKNTCEIWSDDYSICGQTIEKRINQNFDDWWTTCGEWYKQNTDLNKEQFKEFGFKNGFNKGDILILMKWREPKMGDIILFKPNQESLAPLPIIHRIILSDPIQTKGDHNQAQLTASNNAFQTDETNISEENIIGIAVARIPYLGWGKLIFVEIWKKLT